MRAPRHRTSLVLPAVALTLFAGACATTPGARPRPFPGAPPVAGARPEPAPPADGSMTASPETASILRTALDLRGVPYRNGGSDPSGFDCSGFTQWVFAQNGVRLPREVRDQVRIGRKVDADDMAPGDLIFFATTSRSASHVGIALDGDRFVHAPSSNGVVRIERLSTRYWNRRLVGVRRIVMPTLGARVRD
jgi:cell wall-associated NlpC family hydrolase